MKLSTTPEDWLEVLAKNDAILIKKRTAPIREKQSATIVKMENNRRKYLLGPKTRERVVNLLLERYGSVEVVNRIIMSLKKYE